MSHRHDFFFPICKDMYDPHQLSTQFVEIVKETAARRAEETKSIDGNYIHFMSLCEELFKNDAAGNLQLYVSRESLKKIVFETCLKYPDAVIKSIQAELAIREE